MKPKMSKIVSVLTCKCQNCRESDMFLSPTFSWKKPFDMKDNCDVCGFNYLPEPGYYYGAMFISYIWTGWLCVFFAAIVHWYLDYSVNVTFAWLTLIMAIMFVYIFRVSRAIWLGFNFGFDPNWNQKRTSKS